jgi:hypothetical protein
MANVSYTHGAFMIPECPTSPDSLLLRLPGGIGWPGWVCPYCLPAILAAIGISLEHRVSNRRLSQRAVY